MPEMENLSIELTMIRKRNGSFCFIHSNDVLPEKCEKNTERTMKNSEKEFKDEAH